MKREGELFGVHPVLEALKSGKPIDKIFIQKSAQADGIKEIIKLANAMEVTLKFVPLEKMNRLTRKNHQGVFAFISPIDFQDIELLLPSIYEKGTLPFLLILDQISDVRNFGAIARTAECAGVDAIIVPTVGAAAINADGIKTSAGALFNIPVCKSKNLKQTITYLRESGIKLVGASEKGTVLYHQVAMNTPIALVMGNEENGISDNLMRNLDDLVQIPLFGETQSLNVSVACGIMIYEVVRQRNL